MLILETFGALLRDPAHWQFELLVGAVEMLIIDVLVGIVAWPFIKRHIHRDVDSVAMRKEDRADYSGVEEIPDIKGRVAAYQSGYRDALRVHEATTHGEHAY